MIGRGGGIVVNVFVPSVAHKIVVSCMMLVVEGSDEIY